MSTRVIILIYVAAVLIFSGILAQASALNSVPSNSSFVTSIMVDGAKVDQARGLLTMQGRLSNPCISRPRAYVSRVDHQKNIVYMGVVAERMPQICVDVMGPRYVIIYDLKSLPLSRGVTFSVVMDNFSGPRTRIEYLAQDYNNNLNSFERHDYTGIMLPSRDNDGNFELKEVADSIKVISPSIPLQQFLNSSVWIDGYIIQPCHTNNGETQPAVIIPVGVSFVQPAN